MPYWRAVSLIAALSGMPCAAAMAQNPGEASQDAVPAFAPAVIAPLPAGGCVWGSTVFSSGAIIIERMEQPVYFRCNRGNWVAFSSSSAAIDAQNKADGGSREPGGRR